MKWCSSANSETKRNGEARSPIARWSDTTATSGRGGSASMFSAIPTFMVALPRLPGPDAVPRMRLPRHLAAPSVDRGAGGKEDRLQIGAAKAEVSRDLRGADDADPRAVGCEHPGAAGAGAVDPALDIDLHAVRDTVGLLGRHVGKNAPPHHVASGIELDRVDVLRLAGVGDIERALVRREGQPVRVLELGDEAFGSVGHDPVDPGMDEFFVGERDAQTGVGEPDAAVGPADDVVGAVDPLALIAVHQHRHTAVGGDAGDPAVAAFADHEAALQVEGRAVALAGLAAHDLRRLARP